MRERQTPDAGNSDSLIVWIALIEVRPRSECTWFDADEKGAATNVLALARDQDEFRRKAVIALDELDCELIDWRDVFPFARTLAEWDKVKDELVEAARRASETGETSFTTFHTYPEEDKE